MTPEERIAVIQKKIIKISIVESPGSIMVALGFYAKFGANGDAFHPLLNDPSVVNGLLIVGAVIMISSATRIFSLKRECTRLKERIGMTSR